MHATEGHSTSETQAAKLYVSLELAKESWKLTFAVEGQLHYRRRSITGGRFDLLLGEVALAKRLLKLAEDAPVITCYEAGRDGFWLHRALVAAGYESRVLDASSLEVDRRQKRAKTDRLDGQRLVRALLRYEQGDRSACRVVHVPPAEDEDARHLQRELQNLRDERTRHTNQMRSLLFAQGIRCERIGRDFLTELSGWRTGDDQPLPPHLCGRLRRDFERLALCVRQIHEQETAREKIFRAAAARLKQNQGGPLREQLAARLFELCGIGDESAWTFALELFGWRNFANRRQLGAVLGLTPVPFSSGQLHTDQGLSKTGNSRLRALTIELAWLWLRYQPDSALSKWFQERFALGGRRMRRVGFRGRERGSSRFRERSMQH